MPSVHCCVVVQLDSARAQVRRIRALNPDGLEGEPCVFVALVSKIQRDRFAEGDFSSAQVKEVLKHGVTLLPGTRRYGAGKSSLAARKVGLNKQQKRIEALRDQGWWVANQTPKKEYSVYVIELDRTVRTDETRKDRVKKVNPNADPTRSCFYVGQTKLSPEGRWAKHKAGADSSSEWPREFGVCLRPDLYEHLNPMTELASLTKERALCLALRKKGYTVMGGH